MADERGWWPTVVRKLDRVLPPTVRRALDAAAAHHTLTLAAGLAFFGLLSFAPAIGVALGVLRLLTSDQTVQQLVSALQDTFPETLGFSQLLEQMQGRAARYAGIGLLALLWPATTLASGWTRALDAVQENDSPAGVRGALGRAKGLALGLLLLLGVLGLLVAVLAANRMIGAGLVALVAGVVVAAFAFQVGFCMLVYRVLPTEAFGWRAVWPGALVAAAVVILSTVAFALLLTLAGGLAKRYPPTLSTALVIGAWLYAGNIGLLLGAELNAARQHAADD